MIRRPATALLLAAAICAAAAIAPEPAAPAADGARHHASSQLRARVVVGSDGNGVAAGSFAAARLSADYVLEVRTGCVGPPGGCPAPVERLSVAVNGDEVLTLTDPPLAQVVALPEGTVGEGDNRVVIVAGGPAGSAARVRVLAVGSGHAGEPPHPSAHRLLHRGVVIAGEDGNGAVATRFATGVAAPRYVLAVDPVCTPRRCAAPVSDLRVELNGEIVLAGEGSGPERVGVRLLPRGAGENDLLSAVGGSAGSAVRVRIFAVSPGPRGAGALSRSAMGSVVTRDSFMLPEVGDEVL